MRAAWLCLVLAACSSPGAIEVIVNAPPALGVMEVELYVGMHHPQDTPQILPLNGKAGPNVWFKRDRNRRYDVEMNTSGSVAFLIEAGDDSEEDTAAVVAVGFGQGPAGLLEVAMAAHFEWTDIPRRNEVTTFVLELAPFDRLPRTTSTPDDKQGLLLWGPPGGSQRECVQVDNVAGIDDYDADTGMIVTSDDKDCDGELDDDDPDECVEEEYMSQARMFRDQLVCATRDARGSCVAGGETCVDTKGLQLGVCSPSAYCAPSAICNSCMNTLTPARDCEPYVNPDIATFHLRCSLFRDSTSAEFCPGTYAHIDLSAAFPAYGLTCDHDRIALIRHSVDDGGFTNKLTLSTGATLELITADTSSCKYDLVAQGLVPLKLGGSQPIGEYFVAIAVPLDAPVEGRGLLLPVAFTIEPAINGCNNMPSVQCIAVAPMDPELDACLHQPTAPGTITFD